MAKATRHEWAFIGSALVAALALTAVVLVLSGIGDDGIKRALRLTARFSYLVFLCAYGGSSLAALFAPHFRTFARHGREFGLAFASAHTVHLGLVIWLYQIAPEPPLSTQLAIFFGIGMLWMYVLAIVPISRTLRFIGLEYLQLAFLFDFIPLSGDPKTMIAYLPFTILGITATALRFIVWLRRRVLTNLLSGA